MPSPELMTWVPSQKRWTKMYMGRRYYISARQLGTAETKEASLNAANQWWRDKQAELDYTEKVSNRTLRPREDLDAAAMGGSPNPRIDLRTDLIRLLYKTLQNEKIAKPKSFTAIKDDWEALLNAQPDQPLHDPGPEKYREIVDPQQPEEDQRNEGLRLLEKLLEGLLSSIPEQVAEHLPPARVAQIEQAVKEIRGESQTDTKNTVGAQVDDWLLKQKVQVSIGGMTPVHWNNERHCLLHFAAFLGETADVSVVNADRLEGFHYYCLSKIAERAESRKAGWSARYAREVFAVARRWVRWLWEQDKIELPKNLNRRWSFGSITKEIETWTVEEVRRVISEAPGKLKLALLLMCNCGMTQKDVSDLQDDEVNWQEGRITRKRSKTRKRQGTPTVCYKLWPQTFALLKKYRSGKKHVLLTKFGKTYRGESHDGAKLVSRDVFASSFGQLCKRIKFDKQMKLLRKTSATLLESHEIYGRLTSLFLGHAPASVKDRHYAAPPQALFDEGIEWLGKQLGLA